MSEFHDVRLEVPLAFGVRGGPEGLSDVVRLASGAERRLAKWARMRRRWDVGGAVVRQRDAAKLVEFFEARGGRLNGFRFRDRLDWTSAEFDVEIDAGDQEIGVGDGVTRSFQLVKAYENGGERWVRVITRPVEGAGMVALDGAETQGFELDVETGVVTFDEAPGVDVLVTAGFEFDVPVRFDMDHLSVTHEGPDAVRVGDVPIVEIAS